MESYLPLHLSEVAIEKGALGSPSTKVANFTFFYLNYCLSEKKVKTIEKAVISATNIAFGEISVLRDRSMLLVLFNLV